MSPRSVKCISIVSDSEMEIVSKHTFSIKTSFYSSSKPNSSRNRLTLFCFACDVSSVMKESTRAVVSGRFTVKPSLPRRPLRTSNPEDDDGEEVGEVTGELEGEMAVLIFVVRLRRIGMFAELHVVDMI
jgi:hypothetical protein